MFDTERIKVTTPLASIEDDDDGFRFGSLKGFDAIGACFRFELTLYSLNHNIKSAGLLGGAVCVEIEGDTATRFFNGIVSRFRFEGVSDGFARYVLVLRPELWFLDKASDNRIFQEMTAPEIISQVLDQHGVGAYEIRLNGSYPLREYCVQYNETDLNFIERLMQHEGMWYYFEFKDGLHRLIIVDNNETLETIKGYEEIRYDPDPRQGALEAETVSEWKRTDSVVSASWVHTDYDFERPSADLMAMEQNRIGDMMADKERYDYPGRYIEQSRGDTLARVRNIDTQSEAERAMAVSSAQGMSSGYKFRLSDHPRDVENDEFFILHTKYDIWDAQYVSGRGQRASENGFEAEWLLQPVSLPFHPRRVARRPVMRGPQTAVVVGPAGEEIYTDEYSRVKVQFHWDRDGKKDENTTCFIRVSSVWAGSGWGFIQIPRIGQEVIVDFLEGDPDQPIITGRVYNAEQMPPYGLPDNATRSGWKSNSSPGGGGFNELRFEDKKGSEEVYFQAEKDHNELVKNNESRNIGNDFYENVGNDARQEIMHDRSEYVANDKDTTVDKNRKVVIGLNDTESVGVDRSLSVGANESISIGADSSETIGANHKQFVGMNQTVTVSLVRTDTVGAAEMRKVGAAQTNTIVGFRSVTVGAKQSHSIAGSDTWKIQKDQSITIGESLNETIAKDASQTVGENLTVNIGKNLVFDAGDEIVLKTGSASIIMKKDGTIQIKGKDIKVQGSGKIDVKASSSIKMKGSKIDQN